MRGRRVPGMTCAAHVEHAVQAVPDVTSASPLTEKEIRCAVRAAGCFELAVREEKTEGALRFAPSPPAPHAG